MDLTESTAPLAAETRRLESLHRLEILDTPAEERFDRITRLTKRVLGAPIALVSLVDRSRQWFKSTQGLDALETDRAVSFCNLALGDESTLVVPDALVDPRFRDNPLVVGEPGIRSYAGRPVRSPDGERIGALCVIDRVPRCHTSEELDSLADLAMMVERELEVRTLDEVARELRAQLDDAERRASVDGLTRTWNREFALRLLDAEVARAARAGDPLAVLLADVDRFKAVNDQYGHPAGDRVLAAFAERLRQGIRTYDSLGRYGGDEFLGILPRCPAWEAAEVANRILGAVSGRLVATPAGDIAISASLGVWVGVPDPGAGSDSLIAAADRALYEAKRSGRGRVQLAS